MHDIIVIGGSTGGLEALGTLVPSLPSDLQAAVFVVLHIGQGSGGKSYLADILKKSSKLPVVEPHDGDPIQKGTIYVPVPDRHLLLEKGRIRVDYGPQENLTRPAINPLFRSAAKYYGSRVIGVILSGTLDDGVAGLAEIKRRGGIAVVQEPGDAVCTSMPLNAMRYLTVDHAAAAASLGELLTALSKGLANPKCVGEEHMEKTLLDIQCPECGGPLTEQQQGEIVETRCKVGHAYSPLTLLDAQKREAERLLWACVVVLEAAAQTADKISDRDSSLKADRESLRRRAKIVREAATRFE